MAILNISEALRLFRFDNELDSSSCMSQVDCPKSKKLPTFERLLEPIYWEQI
jgi:hypothetical protein